MDSDDDSPPPTKKGPRTATDRIIDEALAEEQARKKAKKGGYEEPAAKGKDGKTLAEIEEEEGGPVKESLVGMAQVKRAMNRKDKDKGLDDDTEIPKDVDRFAEATQVTEEDGIKFTGFNLEDERAEGDFDEDGIYVQLKKDGEGEKDAWIGSTEVVKDEVRKKIEARQKAEAEAEAAQQRQVPLTDRQIAGLKREMAQHMLAEETLAKALKRLGANQQRAMGKREKQRAQQEGGKQHQEGSNAALFARFTDIADQLLIEGEVDVYDQTKEDMERFAAMWLPKEAPAAGAGQQGSKPAAAADDDDDMFADDDDDKPKVKPSAQSGGVSDSKDQGPAAGAGTTAGQNASSAAAPPPATDGVDYASWPIKELKRFLQERGVDPSGYVEKVDMVSKVQELAAAGPQTAAPGVPAGAFPVPEGYVHDASSGSYYNSKTGMYFDSTSGYFFAQGRWYTYDTGSGQFVQLNQ